jgi:hypothetical protein
MITKNYYVKWFVFFVFLKKSYLKDIEELKESFQKEINRFHIKKILRAVTSLPKPVTPRHTTKNNPI